MTTFSRFLPNPEFRPNYPDAPTNATRAEAEAEQCRWQADAYAVRRGPMPGQETLL